jgi:hypothetical protein
MTRPDPRRVPPPTSAPWKRPRRLGYSETLRGLGGIVAPLLTGFSLTSIALLLTSATKPPLADWAVLALTVTVACLLFSMQVAFLALARSPSPADILTWEPQVAVSREALQKAREEQAANFADMKRFWDLSGRAYDLGLVFFLTAVLLLLIPPSWSAPRIAAVVVGSLGLCVELWWALANQFDRLRHPVVRDSDPATFARKLAPLDQVGFAAVLDPDRERAASSRSEACR